MQTMVLIFVGSGIGGVLRHLLTRAVHACVPTAFPLGTLLVNILGCLAIGILGAVLTAPGVMPWREELRAALVIGLLGGFTTFSAFGRETMALAADHQPGMAILNVVLSVAFGLLGVWLGGLLGSRAAAP